VKEDLMREVRANAMRIGVLIGVVIAGILVAVLGGGKY
jgi:hypothetical protein